MQVSVRELKSRLSEYLRRAGQGEEFIVTSHGRPVGRLLGPPNEIRDSAAEAIERLNAQPWIDPGNGRKPLGPKKPIDVPDGTTEALLDWVRGE